ncbi:hypothetical protein [Caldivirga maquilingensis]|uniref:Uncharacterized protein n=1 Tax=Caldivirga maquilingensis (strain ATCC 700844 / DSM 13496 / JCM 10307 / IC-167) TaxID=397948 RepID=A8MBQ4_CALMQ|nr:hypothetical protein [Caldivirga maquilingensis]ABW01247.1 hypothetical protein Cmaq_0401 [Caldivirga maquilingensis IC-167]
MRSRLSDLVESLRVLSDGKWVSLRSIRYRVPFNLTFNDLLELSRRGLIDTYVDLASGEVYVKVRQVTVNEDSVNVNEVAERIVSELKEPMPKPAFEELLRKMTGSEWPRVYAELINRGVVREMEFNGMVFLTTVKPSNGQPQGSEASSKQG